METTKLFFLYCIFSEQNDVRGEKKLGCTIHPVHRLQVYNTGDAPGSEKRYAGLWLVRANTHIDMRKLEKQLHRQFAHVRLKRSNGALTEWFRLSFQEVADFLNAQDHVIRQLSHEEIYDIHVKADRQLTVAEQAAYDEEEALIHAEKEQGSLKDVFFSTFLPDVVPRRIQVELWDTFSAICYSNHALFKGIVQWPTGTGKTIAILLMIVLIKDRCRRMGQIYRGLLVTPRNDIFGTITGIFSHLSAFGITVLDGSNGRLSRLSVPADTDILIMACPSSLLNEDTGLRALPNMTHVHYDEVHRITGELFFQGLKEMLVKWGLQFLTGTSATPKTSSPEQHRKLAEVFDDPYTIIHKCDVDEAVSEGWIAIPRFAVVTMPCDDEASYCKAFAAGITGTIAKKQAARKWTGGKCIAYARSIVSAKTSAAEFTKMNPDAHVYLALDGERTDKDFVDAPVDGSVRVLFACDRYREGSDIKGLDMTAVLIGNSISAYILIQIQGRSLRNDYASKEGWCLIVSPCEEGETEEDVLDRIALDILTFVGNSRSLTKKDIVRYVEIYFSDVMVSNTMCTPAETVERIQAAYIRREYGKRTPKERYAIICELNKEMGLGSKEEYHARWSEHAKFIPDPSTYFKDWWVSWYHFLGVDTTSFPQTKSEWIRLCKEMGLTTWDLYKQQNSTNLPANPGEMYEDYTNWDQEFGGEEEIVW